MPFIEDEDDEENKGDGQISPTKRIKLSPEHKYLGYVDTNTTTTYLCHLCYSQHDKIKTFHVKGKLYEHYSTVHYRAELEDSLPPSIISARPGLLSTGGWRRPSWAVSLSARPPPPAV